MKTPRRSRDVGSRVERTGRVTAPRSFLRNSLIISLVVLCTLPRSVHSFGNAMRLTFRKCVGHQRKCNRGPLMADKCDEPFHSGRPTDTSFSLMDRRSLLLGATAAALYRPSTLSAAGAPTWSLGRGVEMPTLALNTVGLSVEETELAVRIARGNGITHVDFHPGKERDGVARAIASSGRTGLFLTTKIRKAAPGTPASAAAAAAEAQIEEDLRALGVGQVDMLMLRDSPDCATIQAQWAVLEAALAAGKTRSVGVINFCQSALECVLQTAKVKPAVNYFMLHVGMGPDAHGLRSFGEKRGIKTFAYGAVGEPGPLPDLLGSPVLARIGAAHQRSPAEVALRWGIQSGVAVSVRPTTEFGLGSSVCRDDGSCAEGLKKRAEVFSWALADQDMKVLDALTSPDGNPTLFSSSGCPGAFVMPKK